MAYGLRFGLKRCNDFAKSIRGTLLFCSWMCGIYWGVDYVDWPVVHFMVLPTL